MMRRTRGWRRSRGTGVLHPVKSRAAPEAVDERFQRVEAKPLVAAILLIAAIVATLDLWAEHGPNDREMAQAARA
jgi:hypothetical protein